MASHWITVARNAKKDIELLMAIRGSAMRGGEEIALPLTSMTDYEQLVHSEFQKAYGIDPLDLTMEHSKVKYTLPPALHELMYCGRLLAK